MFLTTFTGVMVAATGESSWDKPKIVNHGEDFFLTPRSRARALRTEEKREKGLLKTASQMDETEAALLIQGLWRTRSARKYIRQLLEARFVKSFDEEGNAFYYNSVTGESSWEKPKLLGSDDLDGGELEAYFQQQQEEVYMPQVDAYYDQAPEEKESKEQVQAELLTNESDILARSKRLKDQGYKEMVTFLKYYDLTKLLERLEDSGFEDMESLCAVQLGDLDEMGIKSKYQDPLMKAVKEYKAEHDIIDPFVDGDDADDDEEEEEEEEEEEDGSYYDGDDGEYSESKYSDDQGGSDSDRQGQSYLEEPATEDKGAIDESDSEGEESAREETDSVYNVKEIPGVKIESVFEGDGKHFPKRGQFALVHYTASLEDGTIFESSRKRGRAFDFLVGARHVIPGLDKAIRKMSRGERAIVTIQPEMGYGVIGRPPIIPPKALLRFEVELIDNYFAPVGELAEDDELDFESDEERG